MINSKNIIPQLSLLSRASSESSSGSETDTPLSAGLGGSDDDKPVTTKQHHV